MYEKCNFVSIEPEMFEEVENHEVWWKAMEEEIKMTESYIQMEL